MDGGRSSGPPVLSPAAMGRPRPTSANTRLRQKPSTPTHQDLFSSLGLDAGRSNRTTTTQPSGGFGVGGFRGGVSGLSTPAPVATSTSASSLNWSGSSGGSFGASSSITKPMTSSTIPPPAFSHSATGVHQQPTQLFPMENKAVTTHTPTSTTTRTVTTTTAARSKPSQLFSMEDTDMFDAVDDGWGIDSPSTVLSNPMEEEESKAIVDDFAWADEDDTAAALAKTESVISSPSTQSASTSLDASLAAHPPFSYQQNQPHGGIYDHHAEFNTGIETDSTPPSAHATPTTVSQDVTADELSWEEKNDSASYQQPTSDEHVAAPATVASAPSSEANLFWGGEEGDDKLFDQDDNADEEWDETPHADDVPNMAKLTLKDQTDAQASQEHVPTSVEATTVTPSSSHLTSNEAAYKDYSDQHETRSDIYHGETTVDDSTSLSTSSYQGAAYPPQPPLRDTNSAAPTSFANVSSYSATAFSHEVGDDNIHNNEPGIKHPEAYSDGNENYASSGRESFSSDSYESSTNSGLPLSAHGAEVSFSSPSTTTEYDRSRQFDGIGSGSSSGEAYRHEFRGDGANFSTENEAQWHRNNAGIRTEPSTAQSSGHPAEAGEEQSSSALFSGGDTRGSFPSESSHNNTFGYGGEASFESHSPYGSSTRDATRDHDGNSIASFGVSSAGATVGDSEYASEDMFSDGNVSETRSMFGSSNASTAFGTDIPSVSEGQFSIAGTVFGGSDNVSDTPYSDGNASETYDSVNPSNDFQANEVQYSADSTEESHPFSSSSNPPATFSAAPPPERGSLFNSDDDSRNEANSFVSSSTSNRFEATTDTTSPFLTTKTSEREGTTANVTGEQEDAPSASLLFSSTAGEDVSNPFSSFNPPSGATTPSKFIEHELPTSDAGDLFASTPPANGFGSSFGQANQQGYGDGYHSYNQGYEQQVGGFYQQNESSQIPTATGGFDTNAANFSQLTRPSAEKLFGEQNQNSSFGTSSFSSSAHLEQSTTPNDAFGVTPSAEGLFEDQQQIHYGTAGGPTHHSLHDDDGVRSFGQHEGDAYTEQGYQGHTPSNAHGASTFAEDNSESRNEFGGPAPFTPNAAFAGDRKRIEHASPQGFFEQSQVQPSPVSANRYDQAHLGSGSHSESYDESSTDHHEYFGEPPVAKPYSTRDYFGNNAQTPSSGFSQNTPPQPSFSRSVSNASSYADQRSYGVPEARHSQTQHEWSRSQDLNASYASAEDLGVTDKPTQSSHYNLGADITSARDSTSTAQHAFDSKSASPASSSLFDHAPPQDDRSSSYIAHASSHESNASSFFGHAPPQNNAPSPYLQPSIEKVQHTSQGQPVEAWAAQRFQPSSSQVLMSENNYGDRTESSTQQFGVNSSDQHYRDQFNGPSTYPRGFDAPLPQDEVSSSYPDNRTDVPTYDGFESSSLGHNGAGNPPSDFFVSSAPGHGNFAAPHNHAPHQHPQQYQQHNVQNDNTYQQRSFQHAEMAPHNAATSHAANTAAQSNYFPSHGPAAPTTSSFQSPYGNDQKTYRGDSTAFGQHGNIPAHQYNTEYNGSVSTGNYATATPVMRSNKYKDPCVVPPSCLTSFGFGGNVVTMFPKRKLRLNTAGSGFRNSPRMPVPSQFDNDGELRKGPVNVYRMEQLHPQDDYFEQLETFPGPLTENVSEHAIMYGLLTCKFLDERLHHGTSTSLYNEDERLLLGLLKILIKCNGKLRSEPGANPSDLNSPESLVAALLSESSKRRNGEHVLFPAPKPVQMGMHRDLFLQSTTKIRELLLVGDRKGAVEVAINAQMWPEAMLIASFTDKDEYKRVLKTYLDGHYSVGDPCRALYMSFADQQEKSVQEPQKLLQTHDQHSKSPILSSWVSHAQVVIANRTADTNKILTELGDRLWKESGSIAAGHVCYLLAGASVEAPSPNSRIALLGADHRTPKEARFYVSASAVQRTEVYEWVQKRLNGNTNSMIPFQGYKLIYSMILADHGKLESSFKYVSSMLSIIKAITATMKPGTSMYLEGMQNQLTVLDDRLRQHLGQDRVESVSSSSAKQGKWGLGSALSIMGKIVNRVVEGNDAPNNVTSTTASGAASSLFQGAPRPTSSADATNVRSLYPSDSTPSYSTQYSQPPGSANGSTSGTYGPRSTSSHDGPGSHKSGVGYPRQPTPAGAYSRPTNAPTPYAGYGGHNTSAPLSNSSVASSQGRYPLAQRPGTTPVGETGAYYGQPAHDYAQGSSHTYGQTVTHGDAQGPPDNRSQAAVQGFEQGPPGNYGQSSSHSTPQVGGSYQFPPAPRSQDKWAQAPAPRSQDKAPVQAALEPSSYNYGTPSTPHHLGLPQQQPGAIPPGGQHLHQYHFSNSAPGSVSTSPSKFQKPTLDLSGDAGKSPFSQEKTFGGADNGDASKQAMEVPSSKSPTSVSSLNTSGIPPSGPSSEKGKSSPRFKDTTKKKTGRSKTPPPSGSKASSGWLSGLSSFIATKMNPEVKVAKLGEQMEAYFDEEKKRWVFPGETTADEPAIPSAPPKGPMPGSVPSSTSGGGPPGGPPGTHSAPGSISGGSAVSDDPLAALMAPPPSRAHASLMKKDPLAAMMAPPPRYGVGPARANSMPAVKKPPRPQFAVFKPVAQPGNPGSQEEPPAED